MATKNNKTTNKASAAPPRYVVLHSQVGGWLQGAILVEKDLPEGADLQRLLELGALGLAPPEIEAGELSPEDLQPPVPPATEPPPNPLTVTPPPSTTTVIDPGND